MPSSQRSRSTRGRVPLADELATIGPLKNRSKKRKPVSENEGDSYVDSRSSRKILKIAQDLAEDEEKVASNHLSKSNPLFEIESRRLEAEHEDSWDDDETRTWEDEDFGDIAEVVSLLGQRQTQELMEVQGCRSR